MQVPYQFTSSQVVVFQQKMPVFTFLVEESLTVLAILSLCLKNISVLVSIVGFLFSRGFCLVLQYSWGFCGHCCIRDLRLWGGHIFFLTQMTGGKHLSWVQVIYFSDMLIIISFHGLPLVSLCWWNCLTEVWLKDKLMKTANTFSSRRDHVKPNHLTF